MGQTKLFSKTVARCGISLATVALSLALTGCAGSGRFPGGSQTSVATTPEAPAIAPVPEGTVRVGLILPLSASGNAGSAATALKNAAEMALAEYKGTKVQLVIKDDHGTSEGGRNAAAEALAEGAEVLLGPLLAPAVVGAAQVARPASRPVIAFSTDASVAGRGVYLLSFMPENDVDRIVEFAATRGMRSIAAMIPETAYGTVVNAAFQEACARRGIRVAAIARYTPGTVDAAAKEIASLTVQTDALFLPENGEGIGALSQALSTNGVAKGKFQMLGTGVWDDPRILNNPVLQGGWFAAPDRAGFTAFAQRYRTRYGAEPTRIASLAYDAVFLVSALSAQSGGAGFSPETLQNPEGVIGTDGLFRFKADGTAQRALAVMQVANGSSTILAGAARSLGQVPTQ